MIAEGKCFTRYTIITRVRQLFIIKTSLGPVPQVFLLKEVRASEYLDNASESS